MESLSRLLQPFKGVIGQIASYLTIAQFFSGVFICLDIRKKGNCKDISAIPFIGGATLGVAFLKYGAMLQDPAMLLVNVVAIGINLIYCCFYYHYSTDKWEELIKPASIGTAIVAALLGYCEWEDPTKVEYRFGLIVTVLMLAVLGAPLFEIKDIIANQDASKIPFVLTVMGTIVTFTWFLYSIILMNEFMLVQNVIGFTLCFVQLTLIFLYPGQGKTKSHKKKKN